MDELRDLFLKYDYPEAKDLCKQFLTLNAGVLVFSLTFAEKVIDFENASPLARRLLFGSWSSLFLSLILCGASLAYISVAAGRVVYGERNDYQMISVRTLVAIVSAGVF